MIRAGKLKNSKSPRRGAAMIELAFCLPIFFLITMATVETCRMIYVRQSLKIAAYECARLGIIPKMQRQTLVDQCDLILQGRQIQGYTFSCTPYDPSTLAYGDSFTVTVHAAAEDNDLLGAWFFQGKVFDESVAIMAEY